MAILTEMPLTAASWRGLYAITDPLLMPGEQLFRKSEAALRGGCRVLQYRHKSRNKTATDVDRQTQARALRTLCDEYAARLIINDDPELALAVKADGVHLGQTDISLPHVRERVGARMLIGVSCHGSLELARRAEQAGADYVAFGRFFASHTKPQAPAAEQQVLVDAKQRLRVPVVAIGGITRDNAAALIRQGADMVAVIHELFAPDDLNEIERRAHAFSRLFS